VLAALEAVVPRLEAAIRVRDVGQSGAQETADQEGDQRHGHDHREPPGPVG
jgi:hypothetical protein